MPTTQFTTTIKAIHEGAKSMTAEKAVANIESWETYLSKHDHEGVKAVVTDLGKLKKLLQADELDGKAITTLLHKLGKDTVKVASDGENPNSKHIKELGEALSQTATA